MGYLTHQDLVDYAYDGVMDSQRHVEKRGRFYYSLHAHRGGRLDIVNVYYAGTMVGTLYLWFAIFFPIILF